MVDFVFAGFHSYFRFSRRDLSSLSITRETTREKGRRREKVTPYRLVKWIKKCFSRGIYTVSRAQHLSLFSRENDEVGERKRNKRQRSLSIVLFTSRGVFVIYYIYIYILRNRSGSLNRSLDFSHLYRSRWRACDILHIHHHHREPFFLFGLSVSRTKIPKRAQHLHTPRRPPHPCRGSPTCICPPLLPSSLPPSPAPPPPFSSSLYPGAFIVHHRVPRACTRARPAVSTLV